MHRSFVGIVVVAFGVAVGGAACGGGTVTVGGESGGGSPVGGGMTGGSGGGSSTAGGGSGSTGGGSTGGGSTGGTGGGAAQAGCEGVDGGCYTVYAHSNTTLFSIDLLAKSLVTVGAFNAPGNDVMTDLAVAPDGVIWTVSNTALYQASAADGHVTKVASLSACGQQNVALTFMPDGTMYVADFKGALCRIDYQQMPVKVTSLGALGGGWAISGDLVGTGDGTMWGTAYLLSDASGQGTQANNVIVTINPTTRAVTRIGSSGSPKLFGTAWALGKLFAFTHDGTGHVITVDPRTGVGTPFNTFNDPATNQPISFAGAGVNALVPPMIN